MRRPIDPTNGKPLAWRAAAEEYRLRERVVVRCAWSSLAIALFVACGSGPTAEPSELPPGVAEGEKAPTEILDRATAFERGFRSVRVATGFDQAVSFAFASEGRIFVT